MFYFMSKGDFDRISAIVEVINGKSYLLPNKISKRILAWVNAGNEKQFDAFCLEISEFWCDYKRNVSTDDYEAIAQIIADVHYEMFE